VICLFDPAVLCCVHALHASGSLLFVIQLVLQTDVIKNA